MKLSRKTEYACLALIELSREHGKGLLSCEEIAQRQDIPLKFLEQILQTLKQNRIIKSTRGSHGGYALVHPPEEIPLAHIIRVFDGALAPVESVSKYFYEHTPIEKSKKLLSVFRDIRDYTATKMETTTFADLI